ncbi:MAG: tetratricopeptide repeat protein [Deltaproteobacteria bacterium]|jgi:hypothetical protein|nr:tetratricopeptide repeat protein [Deltaproteobacteria bacterium]
MPLLSPPLLVLAALTALASSAFTCGTALAAAKKPGNRGKGKNWSKAKRKAGPPSGKPPSEGSGNPSAAGSGNPAAAGSGKPPRKTCRTIAPDQIVPGPSRLAPGGEDQPKWRFPDMGNVLERQLEHAETMPEAMGHIKAAFAWDGLRALAQLAFGREDPRVWASAARSARSLQDFLSAPETGEGTRLEPSRMWRASAALAAGALAGMREAAAASPGILEPSGQESGWGEGDGDPGGEKLKRALDAELAFVSLTLRRAQDRTRSAGYTMPSGSLGEALFPGNTSAAKLCYCPSSEELRAALEEAEGPGGPGPKSRQAFVAKSLLGAELWDTGGRGASPEARGLMKKALNGLERLAGNRDPDSLAAKERLARSIAGFHGYWRILPLGVAYPSPEDRREALRLFRSIKILAPQTFDRYSIRGRAFEAESALLADDPRHAGNIFLGSIGNLIAAIMPSQSELQHLWSARDTYDSCEFLLIAGKTGNLLETHTISLVKRRDLLGARHPETACSLARVGDFQYPLSAELACSSWALALESLEGSGGRADLYRADLEMRIGRVLLFCGDCALALPMLGRSEDALSRILGEGSEQTLTCAAFLARAQFKTGRAAEAAETYGRIIALLDGAPPRNDPDPCMPSDRNLLYVALAGAGRARISLGDTDAGERLLKRSSDVCRGRSKRSSGPGRDVESDFDRLVRKSFDIFDRRNMAISLKHGYALSLVDNLGDEDEDGTIDYDFERD